jgi:hypothetical protein
VICLYYNFIFIFYHIKNRLLERKEKMMSKRYKNLYVVQRPMQPRIEKWFDEAGIEYQFCWDYDIEDEIPGDNLSGTVVIPLDRKIKFDLIFFATDADYETVSYIINGEARGFKHDKYPPILFSIPFISFENRPEFSYDFRQLSMLNNTHVIKVGD